jgi:hypothetical protein
MQRLGGGGYTRKNKRGGGNDPSCGCDMQAGWPKFLTENIPLPSMKGGASCGIPPIPNYYQGGAINMNKSYSKSACPPKQQRGGACGACSGLPLPTPLVGQQGGGQPTVYNSNPVPDACPFPGTGYCNFYARGGANNNEVPLGHMLMDQAEFLRFLIYYNRPFPHHLQSGKPKTKQFDEIYQAGKELMNAKVKNLDELRALQWIQDKKNGKPMLSPQEPLNTPAVGVGSSTVPRHKGTAGVQQGGANYGEPMYLQAKLRGGNVGPSHPTKGAGCGCLKGGYKPTKKNLNALKRWKRGESIGFTQTASLKAKGLIPRTSRKYRGKKVVSAKYK